MKQNAVIIQMSVGLGAVGFNYAKERSGLEEEERSYVSFSVSCDSCTTTEIIPLAPLFRPLCPS